LTLSKGHFLYRGFINHRRFTPFKQSFTYPIFLAYVDLGDINNVIKKSFFWNVNKTAIVSFNREDYHGDPNIDLEESVRNTIFKRTGTKPKGPIRLLTHLRYFGYCFNPVSFYYCFDKSDTYVKTILAEVTNTPWKERHAYVINQKKNGSRNSDLFAELKKELHVSPFWGMDHQYDWLFSEPQKKLLVNMKNFKGGNKVFDATLKLKRESFSRLTLLRSILRFPFITLTVVFRIHWQALKLWIKKAPFFIHPKKIVNNQN
tara:strand:- start:40 stop:819 length:780 start_codon:yes stop_codon:yes gene_type:complete